MLQEFTALRTFTCYKVDYAFRYNVLNKLHQFQNTQRSAAGWFENSDITSCQDRCQFPGCHQEREVPRHDLSNNADWFSQDKTKGIFVNHCGTALFATDDPGKISEVISSKRDISKCGFPDRLTVIHSFNCCQELFIFVNDISYFV